MPDLRQLLANPVVYRAFRVLVSRKDGPGRLVDLLGIPPGARVLDIGCGPADILSLLPDDIEYHGFDMSPRYIAAARKRHGARGRFDVRCIAPRAMDDLGQFDVVMAMGVLHHITDAEADTLFAAAREVLRPGGSIVTLDGVFTTPQHPVARILLRLDRGRHVRTMEGYRALAAPHFPDAHCTVHHDFHALPYTINILKARTPA